MFFKKLNNSSNSLLFRLTLLYALIFIISTVITFSIFYYRIYSVTIKNIDSEMTEEVEKFSRMLKEDGDGQLLQVITQKETSEEFDEELYRLTNFKGRVIAVRNIDIWQALPVEPTIDKININAKRKIYETVRVQAWGKNARIITAVIGPDHILQIGESLEEADEYLGIFRNLFLILFSVLTVLSILIGWLLASHALKDMEEFTLTVEKISDGMFNQRVHVKGQFAEIKRLGDAFNKMLDHIQTLLKSLNELNDNIAHELRSPITRIRGVCEMTILGKKNITAFHEMASNTMEECDRLTEMINTMLDITEAEAGINNVKKETFDLTLLVQEASDLFEPMAAKKEIAMQVNLKDGLRFCGNRKKMQRIIANLLENAIKYTPPQGTIRVLGTIKDAKIEVQFKDTGIGISETDLPHIFERFYRCDHSRSNGGSGLGLSLVKAYVESMHGQITVDSALGKGSTFTLSFDQPS